LPGTMKSAVDSEPRVQWKPGVLQMTRDTTFRGMPGDTSELMTTEKAAGWPCIADLRRW